MQPMSNSEAQNQTSKFAWTTPVLVDLGVQQTEGGFFTGIQETETRTNPRNHQKVNGSQGPSS